MVGAGIHLMQWLGRSPWQIESIGGWSSVGESLSASALLGVHLLELPVRVVEAVGGWLLTRRRGGGLLCLRIYAIAWLALSLSRPVLMAMRRGSAGSAPSLVHQIGNALLAVAFPVFLLVWFARAKIRAQVHSWGPRRGAEARPPRT